MSGSRDGGQLARRRPMHPRRSSGNIGVKAMGEVPVFFPAVQRVEGEGERGQGGPGGEENGDVGEGDTAMVIGAEVDDHFAENPLLPLFFYSTLFMLFVIYFNLFCFRILKLVQK